MQLYTFAVFTYYYLTTVLPQRTSRRSGIDSIANLLNSHAIPIWGNLLVTDITTEIILDMLAEKAAHGNLRTGGALSEKTLRNLHSALMGCFDAAVDVDLIPYNPVPASIPNRILEKCKTTSSVQELSCENYLELMFYLQDSNDPMDFGLYLAGIAKLARGCVCALTWGDFDQEHHLLTVNKTLRRVSSTNTNGKTELTTTPVTPNTLHLSDSLYDALMNHAAQFEVLTGHAPGPNDYIYYNTVGTLVDPDNMTHHWNQLLARRGIQHIKLQSLCKFPYQIDDTFST